MSETRPEYKVKGRTKIRQECLVPYSDPRYEPPEAEEIREALRRANLTGAAAGELLGVTGRTVRKWTGDERDIPYSAWRLLLLEARDDVLDGPLTNAEHGCFWGQEWGVRASDEDLEDIGEFPLSAQRLQSSTDPADVVFAKLVWLGKKPTPEAKRHAENFVKWLKKRNLRERSSDVHWMAAFVQGVRLVYLSRAHGKN